jgi:hypothetical protein
MPQTTISSHGKPSALEELRTGATVRITVRRVTEGDERLALDVVRETSG